MERKRTATTKSKSAPRNRRKVAVKQSKWEVFKIRCGEVKDWIVLNIRPLLKTAGGVIVWLLACVLCYTLGTYHGALQQKIVEQDRYSQRLEKQALIIRQQSGLILDTVGNEVRLNNKVAELRRLVDRLKRRGK